MKKFFEEYAGIIIAIVCLISFTTISAEIKDTIEPNLDNVIKEPEEIDFTDPVEEKLVLSIDDVDYDYDDGMTWYEWFNSTYNIDEYTYYIHPYTNEDMLGKYETSKDETLPEYCNITYSLNGGTFINGLPQTNFVKNSKVDFSSGHFDLTKDGYTFKGLYLDSSFENKATSIIVDRDMQLYANFEEN